MMGKFRKYFLFSSIAMFSDFSLAAQYGPLKIATLNVGGNGKHGTFFTMPGQQFTGCPHPTMAFLGAENNPNYEGMLSVLLAAYMAGKPVTIYTSGCAAGGSFTNVSEIVLP